MSETRSRIREELLLSLRQLSDDELVARLKGLAARERRATALLVAHIAELDTRDLYLRAGFSSLFTYCREVLGLSEDEAYTRIEAARTVRRFPVVLDLLAAGEVTLTTVRLLGPHLTAENHQAVLDSARGKRKLEVEEMVARLSPRPDVPASFRRLPHAATGLPSAPTCPADRPGPVAGPRGSVEAGGAAALPRGRPAEATPLSPGRYKYQLTIGGSTLEKLLLAKDMLRHALASGDDEAILDRALTALLTELARRKFGGEREASSSARHGSSSGRESGCSSGRKPGSPGEGTGARRGLVLGSGPAEGRNSREIPVAVKRAVWVRDLGRCAFVAGDGRRCGERAFVEFHHVKPYAVGGGPTVDNIQLRCRRHNGYEARVFFAREPDEEEQPMTPADGPVRARSRPSRRQEVVPEQVPAITTLDFDGAGLLRRRQSLQQSGA